MNKAHHTYGPTSLFSSIILFCLVILFSFSSKYFTYHNDIGWHLEAGKYIITQRAVPMTDPWSFTAAGHPWINWAWLWDILAYLVYNVFGVAGLVVSTVFLGIYTLWLMARICIYEGSKPCITILLTCLSVVAFQFYAPPDVFFSIAPQQVTFIGSALIIFFLWQFEKQGSTKSLLYILGLMLLWSNLHGSYPLAVLMVGIFILSCLLRKRYSLFKRIWYMPILMSLVAVFLTPFGTSIIVGFTGVIGHHTQQHISEWQPLITGIHWLFGLPAIGYLTLYALALFHLKWRTISCVLLTVSLLSLLLLFKSFMELRYFSIFLVLSLPVTTVGLSSYPWFEHLDDRLNRRIKHALKLMWYGVSLLACTIILLQQHVNGFVITDRTNPKQAIKYLMQYHPSDHLLNHWNFGSFVIFESQGSLPLFIDGRSATAYPEHLFPEFFAAHESQEAMRFLLDNYQVKTVLWPKGDESVNRFLRQLGWYVVFEDRLAYVWRKI